MDQMYAHPWASLTRIFGAGLLAACVFAAPASAQLQVGDELKMTLNGSMGAGYGGSFSDSPGAPTAEANTHSVFFLGQGLLSGSYHDPNFLSFSVQPFYNRNQENTSSASVVNSTGIDASVNLFGGSHFPGSVSYSRAFNEGSQYGLSFPGPTGLSGNGTTQNFDISWSALFPQWPTLTATWANSSSSQSIFGEEGTTDAHIKILDLTSSYDLHGFALSGNFIHQNFNTTFPQFIGNGNSISSNTAYSASVSHVLPWSGSFSTSYYRSNYQSDTSSVLNSGTADTITSTVSVSPTYRLSLNAGFRYYNNLTGALQQDGFPPGGFPITPINVSSNGLVANTFASYNIGKGFILVGYASHGVQRFQDTEYVNNQVGGTLTYSYGRPLFGMLYFSFGMVNTGGNSNQGALAAVGNVALKKQINGWEINANANYAQSVQNSIAWFTTSNYSYGGSIRRRFGANLYWSASAQDARTALTQFTGYSTHSETYITSLSKPRYAISATYSQSNGTSILTTSGTLVPTPLPGQSLVPGELVYGGASYGGSLSVIPIKRFIVNLSWFRLSSNSTSALLNPAPGESPVIYSNNDSNRIYAIATYKFRKMDLYATYWRVNQQISASGLSRVINNNYSISIARWFNIF